MRMKKIAALITTTVTIFGLSTFTYVQAEDSVAPNPKSVHKMKADANEDGKISYDEYRLASEKRTERQFKRMDTNGDGSIDQAEKQAVNDKMRTMREKRHDLQQKPEASVDPASN